MSIKSSRKGTKQRNIPSKLIDAQQAVLALKNTMDEEASVLLEERATFEVMRKKLDTVHFKTHIKLNVGGQIFKTSIETLLKDPDSMLASMFSERFDVKPDEEDGAYFIDRDGTHFRYILNYLRTGKLVYPREDKVLGKELYLEAEFYQIDGIQKHIWPGASILESYQIVNNLTNEQKQALLSLLPPQDVYCNWTQLYSASYQGWCPTTFHQLCNKQGPTFMIVQIGSRIFGGYAEVVWSSDSGFVQDDNAFLFTLPNASGEPPSSRKLCPSRRGIGGIWCKSAYGPAFGSANGVSLIVMNNDACASYCYFDDNCGAFKMPEGRKLSELMHSENSELNMSNLEIFGLKETI